MNSLDDLVKRGLISKYEEETLDADGNVDPQANWRSSDLLTLHFSEGSKLVIQSVCSGSSENAVLDVIPELSPKPKSKVDATNPKHYQNKSGIQCIEVNEHMSFSLGNAFKYLYRRGEKGMLILNLQKAVWYLEREMERLYADPNTSMLLTPSSGHAMAVASKISTISDYEPVELIQEAYDCIQRAILHSVVTPSDSIGCLKEAESAVSTYIRSLS